ncbi:hypothetical protein ACOSQ3_003626 [Xanthoceras sorbifolium]
MFAVLHKVKDFHCGTKNNGVNTGHSSGNLVCHAAGTANVTHNVKTPNMTRNEETPNVTHNVQTPNMTRNVETPNVTHNVQTASVIDNVQTASVTDNVQTAANVAGDVQTSATPGKRLGMPLLHHQFKIPKAEPSSETVNLPSTSKKLHKNKKRLTRAFRQVLKTKRGVKRLQVNMDLDSKIENCLWKK